MHISETPLHKAERHVTELEKQLIARTDLIANFVNQDLDTTEAETRLMNLTQTLDSMHGTMALLQESIACTQLQFI